MTGIQRALEGAVGSTQVFRDGNRYWVKPGGPSEVAKVFALAHAKRVPIRLHQGGTAPTRRSTKETTILCDLERMHHVLHLDSYSKTLHVQTGISVGSCEQLLAAQGLTLGEIDPQYTSQPLALALADPGAHRDGLSDSLSSRCLGLGAVLPDGEIAHVKAAPRRATGPDFSGLFLGAGNRFGVITSAVLRVEERPEIRRVLRYRQPTVDAALLGARNALVRGISPARLLIHDCYHAEVERIIEVSVVLRGSRPMVEADRSILEAAIGQAPAEEDSPSDSPLGTSTMLALHAPIAAAAKAYHAAVALLLEARVPYTAEFRLSGPASSTLTILGKPAPALLAKVKRAAARETVGGGSGSSARTLERSLAALARQVDPHAILPGRERSRL